MGEDGGGNSLEDPVCLSHRERHQGMAREAWTCSCFPHLLLHLLQQFPSTASATLVFTAALVVGESLSFICYQLQCDVLPIPFPSAIPPGVSKWQIFNHFYYGNT